MTSQILETFTTLVHSRPHYNARGFININCPACGDKRKRFGFARTETGGFRAFCFNGGCAFNTPTGWEPGNGLNGRIRELFDMLGGSIRDIPMTELRKFTRKKLGDTDDDVAVSFPEVDLPRGSQLLETAAQENSDAQKAVEYLDRRSPLFLQSDHPFVWTPKHPDFAIIPFLHYKNKIVGYLGRNIYEKSGADRFIQKAPTDYMFNQHLLTQSDHEHIIVVESPMEAILLRGIGVRENRLTRKQINLLKSSNKTPILVPDQYSDESRPFIRAAKDNGWYVSAPDFGGKDAGVSIQNKGLLWTIDKIMSEKTKDYGKAKFRMKKKT